VVKKAILSKDVLSGILFISGGGAIHYLGADLHVGTASEMGSGYFPRILAWGLILIGSILVVRDIRSALRQPRQAIGPSVVGSWRPITLITSAVVLFALLIERAGLAIVVFLLVVLSAMAGGNVRWKEIAALGAGMAVFIWAVFIWGLRLPVPVWPR